MQVSLPSHDYKINCGLTCNLNTVLIVWIHLAQFIQFLLSYDSDISPVADILSLLQLHVDFNVFKKIFQVLYSQALPQTILSVYYTERNKSDVSDMHTLILQQLHWSAVYQPVEAGSTCNNLENFVAAKFFCILLLTAINTFRLGKNTILSEIS